MHLLLLFSLIGLVGSGVFIGKTFVQKAIEETRDYRRKVETELIKETVERFNQLPSVSCEDFSGTPSEVFSYLSQKYGVPKEIAFLVVAVESGGNVNLYATSCDICKSCGGITSDRWKKHPKVIAYKRWVFQNRSILEPYLSKGGKVINCSMSPDCWCNVGFGLMQVASFNLKNFPPPESPKPYAPEEEHPLSPYNLCNNLSYGFEILGNCWRKHKDKGKAICCYNGINNSEYLERIKRYAEKLGVERSWKAKIVDFFQINLERLKEWWKSLKGERC